MLASTHAIVGAIFATQLNNPAVAIAASVISHPLLDLFPHWDFNSRWSQITKTQKFVISAVDCGVGVLIGLFLFGTKENVILLLACMIAAQWTDFLEAPYHFGYEHHSFFKGIKHLQHLWHTKAGWPWGFIPQLAIVAMAIWLRVSPALVQAVQIR